MMNRIKNMEDLKAYYNTFKNTNLNRNNYIEFAEKNNVVIQSTLNTHDMLMQNILQKNEELQIEVERLKNEGYTEENLSNNPLYPQVNLLKTILKDQKNSMSLLDFSIDILNRMQDDGAVIIKQINNSEIFTNVSTQIKDLFNNYKEYNDKQITHIEREITNLKSENEHLKNKIIDFEYKLKYKNNVSEKEIFVPEKETNINENESKYKILSSSELQDQITNYVEKLKTKMEETDDEGELKKYIGNLKGVIMNLKIDITQKKEIIKDLQDYFDNTKTKEKKSLIDLDGFEDNLFD